MLTLPHPEWPTDTHRAPAGTLLIRRNAAPEDVLHIETGRVVLGIAENGVLTHRMGVIEGPSWLGADCASLRVAPVVDAVAETPVEFQRVSRQAFDASLSDLPPAALKVLQDVARAHIQQAQLVVSRLAKDADARCAEWLLRHAEPAEGAPGALAVPLRQRKRMIAEQLGIAPETFSRILRQLREHKLISESGKVLNLIDPPGLRALAGD